MDSDPRLSLSSIWVVVSAILVLAVMFDDGGAWLTFPAGFAALLAAGSHFMKEKREIAVFLVGVVLFLAFAFGGMLAVGGGHAMKASEFSIILLIGATFIAFVSVVAAIKLLRRRRSV